MKLAVTYDNTNGRVFREFEKTRVIKIYEVEDGEIINSELVGTMAKTVEDIIGIITMLDADGVLCGDLEKDTMEILNDEGILYYSGFYEDADEAVRDFINGFVLIGPDD